MSRFAWKIIAKEARKPGAARLILIADPAAYGQLRRNNREIFDRICGHHITIPDWTLEEVYRLCLRRLREPGFPDLPAETQAKLFKYFEAT